ncbi:unnamed protein product [Mytilus edulis]|uniref:MULE transposase domain-containing protein n=1 Tax=Mytilus edulis TaxID=6550 RepID=A0A8S3S853_MYTED|nr:unnamed protein product [Mytilus edulis]
MTVLQSLNLEEVSLSSIVNYMTVATFITETEDSDSIKKVLLQLRQWNPEWNPSFFMCDYATEEINAIESGFPDSFVYLCDFHREQAWDRWLNASHNGVQLYKSQILYLLRNIATASTEEGLRTKLSNEEILLLSKGTKFVPSPNIFHVRNNIMADFIELARKMRCRFCYSNTSENTELHPLYLKTGHVPPRCNNALENYT